MKKLLLYAMLIIMAQSQSQTITDLLIDDEFFYTNGGGVNGNELVLISGVEPIVYKYDLSEPNTTLNQADIRLGETEEMHDIAFTDEHVYLHVADYISESSKIIRRDIVDLRSNEEVVYDASGLEFEFSLQLLIRDNFLYFNNNGIIRRIDLNNSNEVEEYFTIPTQNEGHVIGAYTFSEDKFYYNPLNDSDDLVVYELDANNPMGSVEKVVFFKANPNQGFIFIEQLTIIDEMLYFSTSEFESLFDIDFYSLQEVNLSNPNTTSVEIARGGGDIKSLNVYNNLLHFTLGVNDEDHEDSVSKLARVENTLSTPNINRISNFKITPNPNNGIFSLKGLTNAEIQQVTVFDIAGREVYKSQEDVVLNNEIDLGLNLSSGTYILELETVNGVSRQKMVIK